MSEPAVIARDVFKRYKDVTALNGVSLEIKKGEALALLGPNGAGKTTLVKILATLLRMNEGSGTVAGYDVQRDPARVRERIGIVFQDPSLDTFLTGRENLQVHGRLYGIGGQKLKARVAEILKLVGLEDRANHVVRTYSGGMRRRLEIGRGLMHSPEVLFLDEPTLGLDPHARIKVWDFIKDLKRRGLTVLLTTHYMEEADELCERVAIIHHGKIVADGTPSELKSKVGPTLVRFQGDLPEPQKIPGVLEVRDGTPQTFVVQHVDVVRAILQKARHVDLIEVRPPTLQDVFIHLTGDQLEAEAAGESAMEAAWRTYIQGENK